MLKPEDAYNIDTKVDDGKPGTGVITTDFDNTFGCNTSDNSAYAVSNQAIACFLVINSGY